MLQAINVIVLIWILSRFLFKPVANIIAQRQKAAQAALDDAAQARAAAEAARKEAEAEARRQTQTRDATLREAEAQAQVSARALVEAARQQAERIKQEAQDDAARVRLAQREDSEREAAELAVDIAAKALARLPPGHLIKDFAEGLAKALQALPDSARGEIGAAGAPARLLVSHDLSESERACVTDVLARALGRPIEWSFAVDSSLIGGLEIEAPHAKFVNSLREDLRRIRKELTHAPR